MATIYNPQAYEAGKQAAIKRNASTARFKKWVEQDERHPAIADFVNYPQYHHESGFIASIANNLSEWGQLSEKQVDAIWKTIQKIRQNQWDRAESQVNSEYVGEVKERKIFHLKHVNSFFYDSMYGRQAINIYQDRDGNYFKYNGWSIDHENGLDDDGYVEVKATIKEHVEYKGCKQTVINRPKQNNTTEPEWIR